MDDTVGKAVDKFTLKLDGIGENTNDILIKQGEQNKTAEFLALKFEDHDDDITETNNNIKDLKKALFAVAMVVLAGFVGWVFSIIGATPTP